MAENSIPAPQNIQFGQTPRGEHKRVMFDGSTRVRRRTRRRPNTHTVTWQGDLQRRIEIETLHRDKGGQTFQMNLPVPGGFSEQPVKFWGPLSITPKGAGEYDISAQIEVRDPALILSGDLDQALVDLVVPGGAGFDEPLNTLLHEQLPELWSTP